MANTAAMETAGIEEVTKVATEAISNIRTVASLSKSQTPETALFPQCELMQNPF